MTARALSAFKQAELQEQQGRCARVSAEIIRDQQREIAQLKAALELAERQIERLLKESKPGGEVVIYAPRYQS